MLSSNPHLDFLLLSPQHPRSDPASCSAAQSFSSLHAQVQPSANEPLRIVDRLQSSILEGSHVLVLDELPKFMALGEALHTRPLRDHKVEVENGNPTFNLAHILSRDLQLRLVDEDSVRDTGAIALRTKPRFNNHKPSIASMVGHPANRLVQHYLRLDVAD